MKQKPDWHLEAAAMRAAGHTYDGIAYLLGKSSHSVRVACCPVARARSYARIKRYEARKKAAKQEHAA